MIKNKIRKGLVLLAVFAAGLFSACTTTVVDTQDKVAERLIKEPILVLKPIAPKLSMYRHCETLGKNFLVEVPKRFKSRVVYSENVPALVPVVNWNNMIKNGSMNTAEAAAMAKSLGCSSVLAIQVQDYKPYPPFRMVILAYWVDAENGNIIGNLYNDVDLTDSQVNYRYRNYAGHGPLRELYEEFGYSEDLAHSAALSPEQFNLFVASFSSVVMFDNIGKISWWMFWRLF